MLNWNSLQKVDWAFENTLSSGTTLLSGQSFFPGKLPILLQGSSEEYNTSFLSSLSFALKEAISVIPQKDSEHGGTN